MTKLVCESLEEFNILKEAEGEKGFLPGIQKTIVTAPGRVLRKARAKQIIGKYKRKLISKIEKIFPKYPPIIKNLVDRTKKRLSYIDPSTGDEIKGNQLEDILSDLEDSMKQTLVTAKSSMEEQLKVYADSFHNRLERAGTVTNVEFFPEEKANLLSLWKFVEDEINRLIRDKLISLMDNLDISEFQKIKANLQTMIKQAKGYYYSSDDEESSEDENLVAGSDEEKLYQYIKSQTIKGQKIEFDKTYQILNSGIWNTKTILGKQHTQFIKFKIDNQQGKVSFGFYQVSRLKSGGKGYIKSPQSPTLIDFIEQNKNYADGESKASLLITTLQ